MSMLDINKKYGVLDFARSKKYNQVTLNDYSDCRSFEKK